jgi:hypothetical protein
LKREWHSAYQRLELEVVFYESSAAVAESANDNAMMATSNLLIEVTFHRDAVWINISVLSFQTAHPKNGS